MNQSKPNMPPGWSANVTNDPPPPYSQAMGQPATSYPLNFAYTTQPPPQGPIPMAQAFPQATAVILNVTGFGPYPQSVYCTRCKGNVLSEVNPRPGFLTYILSGTLMVLGCWAGCCLIPCCIPEVQDVEHVCPTCKLVLGLYRRI